MMKTDNYGILASRHAISKELPRTIFEVMRNIGNGFGAGVNGLRQKHHLVRLIGKLPVDRAAVRIARRPELLLDASLWSIGLQQRLLESLVEPPLFGKPVFEIWVDRLKNRKLIFAVVPHCQIHHVLRPSGADWTELAFDVANHVAMTSDGQVNSTAQPPRGFVQQVASSLDVEPHGDHFWLSRCIKDADSVRESKICTICAGRPHMKALAPV